MTETTTPNLTWIANYIWGIADDVLRDVYVRGKYRDVILPMTVLRRLDAVLEPTKQAVLDMKESLDAIGVVDQKVRAPRRCRPGLLQHLEVHPEGSPGAGQPPAAQGRLRGLPRWLLAKRPGHPRQLRVPQPDPAPLQSRRPRLADREAHLARGQSEPGSGVGHRRHGPASRPRQSRHGHGLRGADPALQRGEQRGGGRALHAHATP